MKKSFLLLAALIFCLSACSKTISIKIDEISFASASSHEYMVVGDTVSLDISVHPVYAANQQITFSSSDEDVVKVEDGKAIAVGSGSATVTASAANGSKTVECNISVANIYMSGWNSKGLYLSKNGVTTMMDSLPDNTVDYTYKDFNTMQFSGDDVYILGREVYYTDDYKMSSFYWKNGALTLMRDLPFVCATEISVSGSDLLMCGFKTSGFNDYHRIPVLIRNGSVEVLNGADSCYCIDMSTVGSDVYILGTGNHKVMWKNGVISQLKMPRESAYPRCISAGSNGDTYVGGFASYASSLISNRAIVWINGELSYLTDGTYDAQVQEILAIDGGYLAVGYEYREDGGMKYILWKNGKPLYFRECDCDAAFLSLSVFGDKVYIYLREHYSDKYRFFTIDLNKMEVLKTVRYSADDKEHQITGIEVH